MQLKSQQSSLNIYYYCKIFYLFLGVCVLTKHHLPKEEDAVDFSVTI